MKPPQHAAHRWCRLALVTVLLCRDVLSTSTEKIHAKEGISSEENVRDLAKRQTSFQNNEFGQQQIPQDYFDFIQQTDAEGNPVPSPQRPQLGQQTAQQQQAPATRPPTRRPLSPFALEQRELQEEYARRALVEQLTALNRPRTRRPLAAQPQTSRFPPGQGVSASQQAQLQQAQLQQAQQQQQQQQQQQPLRFIGVDGQEREQEFFASLQQDAVVQQQQQDLIASQRPVQFAPAPVPQQQDFTVQQEEFAARQQDAAAQQQEFAAAAQQQQGGVVPSAPGSSSGSISEPFSYAQIQFGPPVAEEAAGATRGRPKGQRSVSRPAGHVQLVDALTQQSVDRPVTTVDSVPAIEYPVTTIGPAVLGAHLLQNVVYIQPNGQMYKPIEDVEPVVQIPRRVVSTAAPASTVSAASTTAARPAPEDEQPPVVLIPQHPPPKKSPGRPRQEVRKPGRARPEITLQQHHEQQHQQHLRQHHDQQSAEVEPDNFLTSLLTRLQQQQQHQPEPPRTTVATAAAKPRGSQRTKGHGGRSEASKYLVDRDQLQLLQFPHELKALSTAELKALEEASAQTADKPVGQKQQQQQQQQQQTRNGRPVTAAPPPAQIQPQPTTTTAARLALGNRPVPKPVELNEQQRQFLLSQGIRNLYRVDYDQHGNALPLTYVLALDNRPKRAEQDHDQQLQ